MARKQRSVNWKAVSTLIAGVAILGTFGKWELNEHRQIRDEMAFFRASLNALRGFLEGRMGWVLPETVQRRLDPEFDVLLLGSAGGVRTIGADEYTALKDSISPVFWSYFEYDSLQRRAVAELGAQALAEHGVKTSDVLEVAGPALGKWVAMHRDEMAASAPIVVFFANPPPQSRRD